MTVVLIIVGAALLVMTWRGTRAQTMAVKTGSRGAALVLAGTLIIGALLMATDPGDNLVITEGLIHNLPSGDRVVRGTVQNRTDRTMSPVRIEIDFIDAESRIVDHVTAETAEIAAGGSWTFEMPVEAEAAAGFRGRVGSPDNVRPAWLGGGCGSDLCHEP